MKSKKRTPFLNIQNMNFSKKQCYGRADSKKKKLIFKTMFLKDFQQLTNLMKFNNHVWI